MKLRLLICCSVTLSLACPGPIEMDGGRGGGTGGSTGGGTGGSTGGGTGGSTGGGTGGSAGGGTGGSVGGGSGGGAQNGSGTLAGPLAFAAVSVAALRVRLSDGGIDPTVLQVGLTDVALSSFCPTPTVVARLFGIAVGTDGGPVIAGTFPVGGAAFGPTGGAQVFYATFNPDAGTSQAPDQRMSVDGGITLTRVDLTAAEGSFNVTMVLSDGGSPVNASGTFIAPTQVCP